MAQRDEPDERLATRNLGVVWLYLADHDEWWRIIVPAGGTQLGSAAQWLVNQGPIAIANIGVQDCVFTWFEDMDETFELPLETILPIGGWVRVRFRDPDDRPSI